MAPRNGARARRTAASSMALASLRAVTAPAASSVSVSTPKQTLKSYCLSASRRNCASLVASPRQIGSTPEAAGSSVPPCPTRRNPAARRTRRTTSNDVGPIGLSITSTASMAAPPGRDPLLVAAVFIVFGVRACILVRSRARLAVGRGPRRALFAQQLLDAIGLLEPRVHFELHRRRHLHAKSSRDGLAKITAGVVQSLANALESRAIQIVNGEQRPRMA